MSTSKYAVSFAKYFDHTLLRANATEPELRKLCDEARTYNFMGVCINTHNLPLVVKELSGTPSLPVCVIGFPLGAVSTPVKVFETKWAIDTGAKEIDMVLNVGAFLSDNVKDVRSDISSVIRAAGAVPVKVIIETAFLNASKIKTITKWCAEEGAAFVKTSSGFTSRGASTEDIVLMKTALKEINMDQTVKIKASGGIKTLELANAMIEAGANRIGSSSSVEILKDFLEKRTPPSNFAPLS